MKLTRLEKIILLKEEIEYIEEEIKIFKSYEIYEREKQKIRETTKEYFGEKKYWEKEKLEEDYDEIEYERFLERNLEKEIHKIEEKYTEENIEKTIKKYIRENRINKFKLKKLFRIKIIDEILINSVRTRLESPSFRYMIYNEDIMKGFESGFKN